MNSIFRINSAIQAVSILMGFGSIALVAYGFVSELYWSGIGLVLLMTAGVQTLGITMARQQEVGGRKFS